MPTQTSFDRGPPQPTMKIGHRRPSGVRTLNPTVCLVLASLPGFMDGLDNDQE
ncbi:hypothetical protein [Corynebacterium sp. CNJ-954]|uniref:hypothetical protein n=1 Tax=Corynebacterium sp. CNJ-954 TaxID=1904962 RepID=UPI0013016719|nr:hypothetical protein [Corynebacterium sp. CNJ-954]